MKSRPRGRRGKLCNQAVDLSLRAGLELDDEQAMVLRDSLRLRRDGRWVSGSVTVNEPRQNGKGSIIEGRKLAGVFLIEEPYQIYSAHQFDTAMNAFERFEELLDELGEFNGISLVRTSRSHGAEGFVFSNGCRIRYRTRTKGGGRGFSCDCLYMDEAMIISEAMHGALLPTQAARPNPQTWYLGSAVDQQVHPDGVVFARRRAEGLRGGAERSSYYEWSAPAEHPNDVTEEMALDPAVWARANPALGKRIGLDQVEKEQAHLDARMFAVERLGVGDWPRTDHRVDSVISLEAWLGLVDASSRLQDPICLSFDVSPERYTSIAAAGRNLAGLWHGEVIETRPGTRWAPERILDLVERWDPLVVVCDGFGPAGSLITPLESLGVQVESYGAQEYARACGRLVDLVSEGEVRHLGSDELAAAIRIASTRPLGDAWAWSRKTSTGNISPLVAVTLALAAAQDRDGGRGGFDAFSEDELDEAMARLEAEEEALAA